MEKDYGEIAKVENNQTIFIKLDAPYRIKYENIESFNDSIFSSVYAQASYLVREIIEKNEEYHNNKRKRGNRYRNQEQIYNVISFVGGRGVGKTSCMLSFSEYLKDYYRIDNRKAEFLDYHIKDGVSFVGIDAIDAGLLEEKEDIVEVVLARLLDAFQGMEDNNSYGDSELEFKKRQFNECLQKVYKSNQKRKQQDSVSDEYVSIDNLQEMAVSLNMRERIKELIEIYIELIQGRYYMNSMDKSKSYVVITIDDIDMNLSKGYQMLEQIRRYLMVPNVIILLSYQYEQIQEVCNLYYYDGMKMLSNMYEQRKFKNKIKYLSSVYLAKVIPDGRRIVLPKVEDVERLTGKDLKIIPVLGDKTDAHSVLDTIMRKTSRCFNIRFWYPGTRMGIWKTANFRELSNMYNELHTLDEPKSETMQAEPDNICYMDNYEWLFDYIKHKAFLELPDDLYEIFEEIVNDDHDELYSSLEKITDWMDKDNFEFYNELSAIRMREQELDQIGTIKSDYGNLLYLLSEMEKRERYREFVRLLKAFYSATISNAFILKDRKPRYLEEILGETQNLGYLDDLCFVERKLSDNKTMFLGRINYISDVSKSDAMEHEICVKMNRISAKANKNGENVSYQKLELLWMFLNQAEFRKNIENEQVKIILTKFEFGISAFIWNTMNYQSHLEKLRNKFEEGLDKKLNISKTSSIQMEFEEWEEKYRQICPFPIWNVDMLVNMTEELERNCGSTILNIDSLNPNGEIKEKTCKTIQTAIEEYMGTISRALKQQDDYYKDIARKEDKEQLRLSEVFDECPVVKRVKDYSKELAECLYDWAKTGSVTTDSDEQE